MFCAILVVTIHVHWLRGWVSAGYFMQYAIKCGIAEAAVPFFFLASGYFLAAHFGEDGWWGREVLKRVRSILVPLFLWTAAGVVVRNVLGMLGDWLSGRPVAMDFFAAGGKPLCVWGLDFTNHVWFTPFWYLRTLFLFVLLAPVFKFGVCRFRASWILALFLVNVFSLCIPDGVWCGVLTFGWHVTGGPLHGMVWFSVGMFLRLFPQRKTDGRIAAVCGIAAIALLAAKQWLVHYHRIFAGGACNKVAVALFLYAVWHFTPVMRLPSWMARAAFPVYLMHMILLDCFDFAFARLGIDDRLAVFLTFAGSVSGAVAIASLLRKTLPRTASVLFGGR